VNRICFVPEDLVGVITGQLLRHVPMGEASSARFVLEDLAYSLDQPAERVIASGSATVASWSSTTTATAGPTQSNGRRIEVDEVEGADLRAPAVIIAPDGARELFEVRALDDEDAPYLEAASTLAGVYPAGSTVRGVLMTAPVPDEFAANLTRYRLQHPLRVTWTYTLDGFVRRVPEWVEFTRYNVAADELAGEAVIWLSIAYPDCRERLPDDGQLDRIAELMTKEVANDLRARRVPPERFLVGDRGLALTVAKLLEHLGELGWSPGKTDQIRWAERAAARYRERLDSLTIGEAGLSTTKNPDTTYRSIFSKM
jgi:hypothetical protein